MAKHSRRKSGSKAKDFSCESPESCKNFCWGFCKGDKQESKFFQTLGFVGPILGSVFGLIMLIIGIFILNFLNTILGSAFVSSVSDSIYRLARVPVLTVR